MRRNLAIFAIAVSSLLTPLHAERWVPLVDDYKLDLDSIRTDGQGITRYHTQMIPSNGGERGVLKTRAVDCARRIVYLNVFPDDQVDFNISKGESELTPLTRAQLDQVCATVKR